MLRGKPLPGPTQARLRLVGRQVDHAVADDQVGGACGDAGRLQRLYAPLHEAQRVRRQAEPLRIRARVPLRNLRAQTKLVWPIVSLGVCSTLAVQRGDGWAQLDHSP